jgi:adenosylhomocysteine nucleosidase
LNGIGVVAALAAEARALGPAAPQAGAELKWLPRLGPGSLLALSGIGCAAAGAAARALVDAQVAALMTFGLAGGLDPALKAGSVVLPEVVISQGGARYVTSAPWRERLITALSGSCAIRAGTLLTGAAALKTSAEKAAAFRDSGAVAVDMESVAVAEVAAIHQMPFIAVRVIVDTAMDTLPPAVVAASRSGSVQIGRLIAGLILAPGDIAALIRLSGRYRAAMRSLRVVGAHLT